jgi:hypothetical protein
MLDFILNKKCWYEKDPSKVEKDAFGIPLVPIVPVEIPCSKRSKSVYARGVDAQELRRENIYLIAKRDVLYTDKIDGLIPTSIEELTDIDGKYLITEVRT